MRRYYGSNPPPAPIGELDDVQLVGDVLLIIGSVPDHRGTDRLVVADAATGAVRWSITGGEPVPGAVGGGGATYDFPQSARVTGDPTGDWTIVTTFARPVGGTMVEEGIIGLAGTDGHPRWRIPVQREQRCTCPWTRIDDMILGPADTSTATVWIDTITSAGTTDTIEATRTIAYDLATRRQAWTASGIRPAAIDGDLLLVHRLTLPASEFATTPPTTLAALDLRTGAERWSLASRYPQSSLTYAAGDTLVVNHGDATALVDAATGQHLGSWPGILTGCGRTHQLFACRDTDRVEHNQVVTIARSATMTSATAVSGSQWCRRLQVWQDLLYCDDATDRPDRSGAIDAAGRVAATHLPGRFEAASDHYAVFSTGPIDRDEGAFAVYTVD